MKNRKLLGGSLVLLSTLLISGCSGLGGLFGKDDSFKVFWKDDEGKILEIDEGVHAGDKAEYNGPKPTKATTDEYTYEFKGWDKTVGTVDQETTFTAQFTATKRVYDITWLDYDNTEITKTHVAYGDTPVAPSAPKRAGDLWTDYTFDTWDRTIVPVTGDATYKAVYKTTTYQVLNIKYHFDNTLVHTVINNNILQERAGKTVALADPQCPGYDFKGWFLDAGYTKQISKIPNISQDMEIYGKFELATYTIEYDFDGGAAVVNPTSVHCTDPKEILVPTSKVGYEFVAWKDASGKVYTELEDICSDLKLTAHYEANEYVVTLRYREKSDEYIHVKYDEVLTLPVLQKDGYIFKGWYYESGTNGGNKFVDSVPFKELEDIVLIQEWKGPEDYDIVYKLDGGKQTGAPTSYSYSNLPDLVTPTREGYTFKGWEYKGRPISLLRDVFEYNTFYADVLVKQDVLELTATWEANPVTIYYDFKGGTLERKIDFYDNGSLVKTKVISPYKFAGFELLDDQADAQFNGWLDEDGTRVTFSADAQVNKDLKLTADWAEIDKGIEGKQVGDPVTFAVNGLNYQVYQYTPLVDMDVKFESAGTLDVKAELITKSNKAVVASNDDISSTDKNFSFDYVLKANTTYLLKVISNSEESGNVDISVACKDSSLDPVPQGKINADIYTIASTTQLFDEAFIIPFIPVHENLLFNGWVDAVTGVRYHDGTTILKEETINLVAQWMSPF